MKYVLVSGTTGTIELLDDSCVVLEVPDGYNLSEHSDAQIQRHAGRERWSTIDIVEQLETCRDEHDDCGPSLDLIEELGWDDWHPAAFDTSPGYVTWRMMFERYRTERDAAKAEVTITENEAWYVRAMVSRGMDAIEEQIETTFKELAKHPEVPKSIIASLEGIVGYNKQMLDEARKFIPESLYK